MLTRYIIAIMFALNACTFISAVQTPSQLWQEGLQLIQRNNTYLAQQLLDPRIPRRNNLITQFVELKKKASLLEFHSENAKQTEASMRQLESIVQEYKALLENNPLLEPNNHT